MAEEERTFDPSQAQVNRGREQGLGVGQKEMDAQKDPDRVSTAIDPSRPERFEGLEPGPAGGDDRNAAGVGGAGELGEGTPANVDIHKLGQDDNPEEDWGEAAAEGTMHSSTNTRRGVKTEAERGQGPKTRQATKDQISRR
jgi:hypothetical protein